MSIFKYSFRIFPSMLILAGVAMGIETTALVSSNFVYHLTRDMFFNGNLSGPSDSIHFVPSAIGHPDLPEWLHFVQRDMSQGAFLYGQPQSLQDATQIQVVAVNKNTMESVTKNMDIKVAPKGIPASYFVELRITNMNLDEVFSGETLTTLLRRIQGLWLRGGDVYISKVISLVDIEGRLPVPSKPGEATIKDGTNLDPEQLLNVKEGVLVQIGGTRDFSAELKSTQVAIQGLCQNESDKPQVEIDKDFSPLFEVDWCKYKLMTRSMIQAIAHLSTTPAPDIPVLDREVTWKTADIPRRNLYSEFIGIVVFPLILTLIVTIVLACAMFGRREGVDKRDDMTPETQLSQFNSIRRATTNLRMMSNRREGPAPLHASPLFNSSTTPQDRYSSFPTSGPSQNDLDRSSTLPREPGVPHSQPPPPYRLPPSYPSSDNNAALVPNGQHIQGISPACSREDDLSSSLINEEDEDIYLGHGDVDCHHHHLDDDVNLATEDQRLMGDTLDLVRGRHRQTDRIHRDL